MRHGDFHFLGAPRGVSQGGLDVLFFEIGIGFKYLRTAASRRHKTDYRAYGHSEPAYARLPTHHAGVNRYPFEFVHPSTRRSRSVERELDPTGKRERTTMASGVQRTRRLARIAASRLFCGRGYYDDAPDVNGDRIA